MANPGFIEYSIKYQIGLRKNMAIHSVEKLLKNGMKTGFAGNMLYIVEK